jgi:hypothetical protein
MPSEVYWIAPIIAGYGAVVAGVLLYLRYARRRRRERDATFGSTLRNGVLNGSIRTMHDVEAFYSAFYDSPQLQIRDQEVIGLALRRVLMTPSHPGTPDSKEHIDRLLPTVRDLIAEHDKQMQEVRRELPFAGTPSPERELLQDVVALAGGDHALIDSKLGELGKAVRIRQETIDRLSDEKGQSLRWAKWGTIGTVVFSLASILLAIWGLMRG